VVPPEFVPPRKTPLQFPPPIVAVPEVSIEQKVGLVAACCVAATHASPAEGL
jgi:hypothetical protein